MSNTPPTSTARPGANLWERLRQRLHEARRRRGGRLLPFGLRSANARLMAALVLSLVVLLGLFAWSVRYMAAPGEGKEISYSRLGELVDAHKVEAATLYDHDHRVTGTFRDTEGARIAFTANYPSSDTQTPFLINDLRKSGAVVTVDPQGGKAVVSFVATYLLPLVILANLFGLIFVGTRSGGETAGLVEFSSIGKGRDAKGGGRRTTFADVAGAQEALIELSEVADYLRDPERYATVGAKPPKGVMMLGTPAIVIRQVRLEQRRFPSHRHEELGDRLLLLARHVAQPVVTGLGDDRDDVLDFLLEAELRCDG